MKKFFAIMLAMVMALSLAACGSSQESAESAESTEAVDLTAITVDAEAKSVSIPAIVNGSFFDTSTMHYIVFEEGSVADSSMMTAYVKPADFYDAMMEIGGQPGNTEKNKIKSGEFVTGQDIDVSITWEGHPDPVSVADSVTSDGDMNMNMVFVGNKDNNADCGSGCIACLNSCYAGITVNNGLAFDDITSGKVKAYLNKDTMPEDGTVVTVTFTLK